MKTIKYIIYKEDDFFVSQSINVDVASFGKTIEEAKKNLEEALELYFEDLPAREKYQNINETLLGEFSINI
jgi:predicted RNase H-like HicB family nuclease